VAHGYLESAEVRYLFSVVNSTTLRSVLTLVFDCSADKLLADAGELGGLQPRMRLPAFTKKWLILRFGKSKFCEQQLADLIATMNALESKVRNQHETTKNPSDPSPCPLPLIPAAQLSPLIFSLIDTVRLCVDMAGF
jgi:hypothetical protein